MRDIPCAAGWPMLRRLPRIDDMYLGRLDRVATADQVAGLLGRPPHQALLDAVFTRTRGNAYLTRLIIRDIPADATSLPPDLPTDLREAAAHTWHGLSRRARQLTQLIAVADDPSQRRDLRKSRRPSGRTATKFHSCERPWTLGCSWLGRMACIGLHTRCWPKC